MENTDPGGREEPVSGDRVEAGRKDPLHSKAGLGPVALCGLCCIGLDLLGNEHFSAGVDRIAEMEERGGSRQCIFGSDDH